MTTIFLEAGMIAGVENSNYCHPNGIMPVIITYVEISLMKLP
jgi:hypothetical protein